MYTGWSFRGRAFTKKEFDNSYLKQNTKMSYGKYLGFFARQYNKSAASRRALFGR